MNLNTLNPQPGSTKNRRRVGRGLGSHGKTCGRGEKGQLKRNTRRLGAEAGNMPLIQRIPKFGFVTAGSRTTADLPLFVLNSIDPSIDEKVTVALLIKLNLVNRQTKRVRLYLKGEVKNAYHCQGIHVTKGAKAAIEKSKGTVSDE